MTYRIKEFNEDYLKSKGFMYDHEQSDSEVIALSRRSTVCRYNNKSSIEVIVTIYSNKDTRIHVYNCSDKTPYSAWYNRYYGKNNIISLIDSFIKKECRKLGIKDASKI